MQRGKLLVISGPSGVGKSTAIQGMLTKHPDMYFSVSATTRKKRERGMWRVSPISLNPVMPLRT